MASNHNLAKFGWENETLGYFNRFLRDCGRPTFKVVGFGERPDALVLRPGTAERVGVEITRCVLPDDARLAQENILHADRLRKMLAKWAPGGHFSLSAGRYPDTSRSGSERFVERLDRAIAATGGVRAFADGLEDGTWEHEGTVCEFLDIGTGDRWFLTNNHVTGTPMGTASSADIDRLLRERVDDKVEKARGFHFEGPLFLIVRNPYGAWAPAPETMSAVASACAGVFAEAWLVNHREGALDASPPEPRLVQIAGFS